VRADDGSAGVVVVIAELLVAHAWAAAAGVVGEDVVALVRLSGFALFFVAGLCMGIPLAFVQSIQSRSFRSGL
jgi:hypothetical protein